MDMGLVLAYVSLALSVFFWWNARQQGIEAGRTLTEMKKQSEQARTAVTEIRNEIIGWQNELNKTAIAMLSSRPEMVAKEKMLADAKAEADFSASIAQIIGRLATPNPEASAAAVIDQFLKHHQTMVLEKERAGFA